MDPKQAIAKIEVARGAGKLMRGTGTLVGERLVLTALHVIADKKASPLTFYKGPIELHFPTCKTTAKPIDDMWDIHADWVLLECERAPEGVHPIPLGEPLETDKNAAWDTFGFPDLKPDGITMFGTIRDPDGAYEGVRAIQLFCEEAAAGNGSPVHGISGAPCLVDGALIGVIRSSLTNREMLNRGGTLYASPADLIADRARSLLRFPDPYRGLPGLLHRDLPPEPYKGLGWYTEDDAAVFFGRGADIRELYMRLMAPDGDPILLFSGQSGVGKSSLLEAGIVPRLSSFFSIKYSRRDAARGLSACLDEAVSGDWRALETQLGKPLLVILDQVEEAYTRPRGDPDGEISALLDVLDGLFRDEPTRIRGRLLLSLRMEFQPKVRARLTKRGLPFAEYFMDRLDRAGIIEFVNGIQSTQRHLNKYDTTTDDDLGGGIATDMLADYGSAVAPTLQIIMRELYKEALAATPKRHKLLTGSRYQALKRQGIHLDHFVDRQIARLTPELKPQVESGLIEDLLFSHTRATNGIITTDTIARAALAEQYRHVAPTVLDSVIRELELGYLLTNPVQDQINDKSRTRLGHDTLAPHVRDRFRRSSAPGPRARRILETRAGEREVGAKGPVLDVLDLKQVQNGILGMRALTSAENDLISASVRARRKARLGWSLLGVMALATVLALVALYGRSRESEAKNRQSERQLAIDGARRRFERANRLSDSVEALKEASAAVALAPENDSAITLYVARALHLFGDVPPVGVQIGQEQIRTAVFSDAGDRIAFLDEAGHVGMSPIDLSNAVAGARTGKQLTIAGNAEEWCSAIQFSSDGKWLFTGCRPMSGYAWIGRVVDVETGQAVLTINSETYFLPGSRALAGYQQGSSWPRVSAYFDGKEWKKAGSAGPVLASRRLAASADGRMILTQRPSAVGGTLIEVVDPASGPLRRPTIELTAPLVDAALSASGLLAVTLTRTADEFVLQRWRVATGCRSDNEIRIARNLVIASSGKSSESASVAILDLNLATGETLLGMASPGSEPIEGSLVIVNTAGKVERVPAECGSRARLMPERLGVQCKGSSWISTYRSTGVPPDRRAVLLAGNDAVATWMSSAGKHMMSLHRMAGCVQPSS